MELPNVGKARSRKIARMRYDNQTPAPLLRAAVFKEVLRLFQAGRVTHEMQREVVEMLRQEIEDREQFGDNYCDWEGGYKARHGSDN